MAWIIVLLSEIVENKEYTLVLFARRWDLKRIVMGDASDMVSFKGNYGKAADTCWPNVYKRRFHKKRKRPDGVDIDSYYLCCSFCHY